MIESPVVVITGVDVPFDVSDQHGANREVSASPRHTILENNGGGRYTVAWIIRVFVSSLLTRTKSVRPLQRLLSARP